MKRSCTKTFGMMALATTALMGLLAGCGGGGTAPGGTGSGTSSGGGATQSKNRPSLETPPASSARPVTSRSRAEKSTATRSHVAYDLGQDAIDWWVLDPDPGTTYEIDISPERGDQDLYVFVNGQWLASDAWGLAPDSLTFTASSRDSIYIAVFGYQGGAYRLAAYYQ